MLFHRFMSLHIESLFNGDMGCLMVEVEVVVVVMVGIAWLGICDIYAIIIFIFF